MPPWWTNSPFFFFSRLSCDLRIIKNAKVRELVNKGPSYREQNNIDWSLNARICKEAVTKYKVKWSRRLGLFLSSC